MVLPDHVAEAATEGAPSDLEKIKDWLESGGDINDVESDGCTILILGICYQRIEVIKLAISRGADVSKLGDPGRGPPLFTAIEADEKEYVLEVLSLLLDAGARINATTQTAVEGCYIRMWNWPLAPLLQRGRKSSWPGERELQLLCRA